MPDVYDRPQCPPGCGGCELGTCRVDSARGTMGHESLFPAQSRFELHSLSKMRIVFWEMVRILREAREYTALFSLNASLMLVRG